MRNILQTTTGQNFPIFSSSRFTRFAVPPYEPELAFGFDLDFYRTNRATKVFDDAITHTRASTATYVDSNGVLQTADVNVPRVGHHVWNGSAWVNEGLLHESEARTNLLTYSEDFTDAAWFSLNTATLAIDATGPDGETSAVTLVDSGATGSGSVNLTETVTVATSTAYTFSVFLKADQLSWASLQARNFTTPSDGQAFFNLSDGTVGTINAGYTASVQDFGSGWYRCSITFTTDASDTSGALDIRVATADNNAVCDLDGTSSVLVYGAQFEAGPTPSSYIPTSGATATRAAETLTIPAANLPYSATAMSIAMEGAVTYADEDGFGTAVFARWLADTSNQITAKLDTALTRTGQIVFQQTASGVNDIVQTGETEYSPGTLVAFNIASRHGSTFLNGAVDGTALTADTTPVALPDLSTTDLNLGFDFMGTIKTFRMWADDLGDTGIEEASS